MSPRNDTLAAIDAGTNSFHLVVVKLLPNEQFTVLDKEKIIVRLGEGPHEIKRLTPEAMVRGVEAMKLFALVAARTGSPVRAVATSAVREASNREEFIERVREATGIELDVVSGYEEARLIYLGVLQALPVLEQRIALCDIGGGSTEFLIGEQGRTLYANSFKIGAIRMTQRFFPTEKVSQKQVSEFRLFVRGEIYHAGREIRASKCTLMVGSSGTVQTVAAMALASRGEKLPEHLNGVTISLREISDVVKRLLSVDTNVKRAALPGIDPRRADIIVAGAITLESILQECGFESITVSSYALREGIVLDSIQKMEGGEEARRNLSDLRYETVMKIGRMYTFDEEHGRHVAELALAIFDGLAGGSLSAEDSRELLEAAALLHDIGYYISHSAHHRHSLYLIQNSEAFGFTEEEIAVVANVARYHRKSHPRNRHPEFAALNEEDQRRVRFLAGVLRIADGLDRTHQQNITGVSVEVTPQTVHIRAACRKSCDPAFELWSADRKKGLLEEVLDRSVEIETHAEVPAEADLVSSQ